jgi:flagellar basal-body rod protein FlgC
MSAQRVRMNVVSMNLANADTTRSEKGGPYRRKMVVMEAEPINNFDAALTVQSKSACEVHVTDIVEDKTPFRRVYNPSHPDADNSGFVKMPNVDLITEMADMMIARRSYEANVTALNTAKAMALKALEIGK